MWLDNLKELKKETGMSSKQIAEMTHLPERTVIRVFSGDTDNPYVDTIRRIVIALGGSLDSIFADTKVVIGDSNLSVLQSDIECLNSEVTHLTIENGILKDKVVNLTAELDLLKLKLEHKEEIIETQKRTIAVHEYYMNRKTNE